MHWKILLSAPYLSGIFVKFQDIKMVWFEQSKHRKRKLKKQNEWKLSKILQFEISSFIEVVVVFLLNPFFFHKKRAFSFRECHTSPIPEL